MVKTINATVYKDAIDTKVGLTVLAKDGKVYVSNLRLLFENSGLQKGDEVVMINGTLVEGMTGAEVVNIIKGIEGNINVVAKREDVETINASVYKDSIDTKVGLTVVDKGGKVYVTNLRLLFENSGLQKGDEIVSINGTHVEGMTSTEVVNIIKGIKGELNVVAKRGDVTPVATAVPITKDGYNPNVVPVRATGIGAPPGNAPPGGVWGTLKYVGDETQRNALIACLLCGILGLCILLCPSDEKDAYAVNGRVYDAAGKYIGPKDDNFTPSRPPS